MAQKKIWQCLELTPEKCEAHTKSQARAFFKKLKNLDRLPVGMKVEEVKE